MAFLWRAGGHNGCAISGNSIHIRDLSGCRFASIEVAAAMACLGLIGDVFSKDRRVKMGGVKQEWQKVRRLLVGTMPTSCCPPDDKDDFGEDFVREMLRADAIQDVLSTESNATPSRIASIFSDARTFSSKKAKCLKSSDHLRKAPKLDKSTQKQKTLPVAACNVPTVFEQPVVATAPVKKDAKMGQAKSPHKNGKNHSNVATAKFVVNIGKPDRQKLRLYLKKGHADDAVFDKLARRWHNYDANKRLAKLRTLQLPRSVFRCCDGDGLSCLCDKVTATRFFTKVCGKASLQCAMLFLSQQRNYEYAQGLLPPTNKQ